ncbi:hypothetical protein NHX12_026235 [Muraenolepis orangiensis]|uniref:Uncharacterized protein n=1 Tax=Muraenolepis orangiensis TaxID=630683 RepID=A0A9Q0IRP7_9TELE|nr:hypothetical protein NHX12_026235 [Muraenolepis orangiensis]
MRRNGTAERPVSDDDDARSSNTGGLARRRRLATCLFPRARETPPVGRREPQILCAGLQWSRARRVDSAIDAGGGGARMAG